MKIWSDVEYVYRCLTDMQRTQAFERAITQSVHRQSVVLDLGTGSGIMALFAARAGARKVYAVEIGDYLYRTAQEIFKDNGFAAQVIPLQMDARDLTPDLIEKPEIVICELVTTGLIGEMQGSVIRALRGSGVIDDQTTMIPSSIDIFATLVQADYTFCGFEMRFPIFIDYFGRKLNHQYQALSSQLHLSSVDFTRFFDDSIQVGVEDKILKSGRANGVLLESTTKLSSEIGLKSCESYCQPVIVPIRDMDVTAGDLVRLSMAYQLGEGFDKFKCAVELAT